MPFNVLLLPLLGGFIFVRYWNRTKYHAIRAEKERILLLASAAGLIALGLSLAIKAALGALFPCSNYPNLPCFPVIWYRFIPFPYSAISVLALLLGATMWVPLNKGIYNWVKGVFSARYWENIWSGLRRVFATGWEEREEVDRVLSEDGDPLDMLLRVAEKESKTIQATLKSGKVYVGFVSSTNPPSSPTRSIGIVPTKSGYRDPATQEVTYQTYYSDALTRLNKDLDGLLEQFNDARRDRNVLVRKLKSKQKDLEQLKGSDSVEAGEQKISANARAVPVDPSKANADKEKRQKRIATLESEIKVLDSQVVTASERATDLFNEMEKVADIINDFRLVFPIAEVSTISIYREEVKIEYFSQEPVPPPVVVPRGPISD